MNQIEKWLEDNYERRSASMEGSCETVEYVPRSVPTPPYAPDTVGNIGIRMLVTLASLCVCGTWVLLNVLAA